MKNITDEIIEEIKLNNDILDVVSEYVKLTRKGKDYFGICPFHAEKTASFSVAPAKSIYYCFGCHAGGGVVQFIMNIENLKYYEAMEFLAKRANIRIPEDIDPRYAESARKKEQILTLNKLASQYYSKRLRTADTALAYLKSRNIREDAVSRFDLGYADDKWDGLLDFLKDKGFSENDIQAAGLVTKNKSGGFYDKFRNRIIFPITDVYGNVIAFGGRVIDDSVPKYLNSPETLLYKKGRHLYGLDNAKKTQSVHLVIVEGYIDVVTLYQEGFDCFVASLGTALTMDQARLANRYDKRIVLAYDNDEAGINATLKAVEILSRIGIEPGIIVLPDSKDPDEFLKNHGAREFKKLLDNTQTPVEYKVSFLKSRYSTDNTREKVTLFRDLIELLSGIGDMTLVDMYASRYSKEFGISKDAIMNDVNRRRGMASAQEIEAGVRKTEDVSLEEIKKYEVLLLLFYFNHRTGRERIEEYFQNSDMEDEVVNKVYERIMTGKKDITLADILECVENKYISSILKLNEIVENVEKKDKALDDFLKKLMALKLEIKRNELLKKGREGPLKPEDMKDLKEYAEMMIKLKK